MSNLPIELWREIWLLVDRKATCSVRCDLGIVYSEVAFAVFLDQKGADSASIHAQLYPSVMVKRVCRDLRALIAGEEDYWSRLNIQ